MTYWDLSGWELPALMISIPFSPSHRPPAPLSICESGNTNSISPMDWKWTLAWICSINLPNQTDSPTALFNCSSQFGPCNCFLFISLCTTSSQDIKLYPANKCWTCQLSCIKWCELVVVNSGRLHAVNLRVFNRPTTLRLSDLCQVSQFTLTRRTCQIQYATN